jgi:WD40-like Beta Propeller Repeat
LIVVVAVSGIIERKLTVLLFLILPVIIVVNHLLPGGIRNLGDEAMSRKSKYIIFPIFLLLLGVSTLLHAGLHDWGTTGVNDMTRVEKVLQLTENPDFSHARVGDYSEPWSGGGSWIVYSVRDSSHKSWLYKIRSDGNDLTKLTGNVVGGTNATFYNASFASDGRIYFDRYDLVNGYNHIYQVDRDGTLKNLSAVHGNNYEKYVKPSPDAKFVAYQDDTSDELRVSQNDGTYPVTVSGTQTISQPQHDWSPDSQWLAFMGDDGGQQWIYKVRPDGTALTPLTMPLFILDTNSHMWPRWSPDGRKIAYISKSLFDSDYYYGLRIISAEDGSTEQYLDSADDSVPGWQSINGPLSWSPDGRWIAYYKVFDSGGSYRAIFIVPSDGSSEPIQLTIAYSDYKSFWSPDGSRILFEDSGSSTSRDGDSYRDLLMLQMLGSYGKFPWSMFLPAITSGNK